MTINRASPATVTVALTTDIGEGFGLWTIADDDALLSIVTSANVACGFHAGDPSIMRRTCEIAAANGVAIGAQFSYNDFAGFGRRNLDVERTVLADDLLYQAGALQAFARAAGSRVSYCRAHGALYNRAAVYREHALAVADAVVRFDPTVPVLCQAGTVAWETAVEAGLPVIAEAFVDRSYTADGLLLSRDHPEALLTDPDRAAARAVRMATEGKLDTIDGQDIDVDARALLVHSDTPGSVAVARATREALEAAGVLLVPLDQLPAA